VSTKESCVLVVTNPLGDHTHTDIPNKCELYVKDNLPHLVTLRLQIEGGLTINGIPLQSEWKKMVVDEA